MSKHGVAQGTYILTPSFAERCPTLVCVCGWVTEAATSWMEAGEQLDEHLADAMKEQKDGQ